MEMEIYGEEMEELFTETIVVDEFVFDIDYEFEAPQFYDFTDEFSVDEGADDDFWFDSASSHPPSPFIIKLNWRYDENDKPVDIASVSCQSAEGGSLTSVGVDSSNRTVFQNSDHNEGQKSQDGMRHGVTKYKTKSPLSRRSGYMKPTASFLAKLDRLEEFYSDQISKRCHESSINSDKSSQTSSVIGLATKRQKLDAGYLRKIAQLKHQALLTHKNTQMVNSHLESARSKVTIPVEPYLETAVRAERGRSNSYAKPGETTKSAHPLNKQILKASSLLRPKKSSVKPTEFQVFHLRTSERAKQHTNKRVATVHDYDYISLLETKDQERLNCIDGPEKEKCEVRSSNAKSLNKKVLSSKRERGVFGNIKHETGASLENNLQTNKWFLNEPLTEPFSKLSLASEFQSTLKSKSKKPFTSKSLKENEPASCLLEQEMIKAGKDRSQRFCRNQYHCGTGTRFVELNNNRKLDIR